MKRAEGAPRPQRGVRVRMGGFTYIGLLFVIAIMGVLAAAAGTSWSVVEQRERERDLLFVGREYRRAIEAYRSANASRAQPYPAELTDLLGNRSETGTKRYLRRLYADPITGSADWGLVRSPQGGIVGVYSLSERVPLRTIGVYADEVIDFANAKTYRDWVFAVAGSQGSAPTGAAQAPRGDNDDGGAAAPLPQWPGGHPPVGSD